MRKRLQDTAECCGLDDVEIARVPTIRMSCQGRMPLIESCGVQRSISGLPCCRRSHAPTSLRRARVKPRIDAKLRFREDERGSRAVER